MKGGVGGGGWGGMVGRVVMWKCKGLVGGDLCCLFFSFKALTVEAALVLVSYLNLPVGTGDEA